MAQRIVNALALVILFHMGSAAAEPPQAMNPEAQQLFEKRRAIESASHAERTRILAQADACIKQAADFQAYRDCEQQERQARQAHIEQLRPQLQALRSDAQKLRANGGARQQP
jgi:hypothetical protein